MHDIISFFLLKGHGHDLWILKTKKWFWIIQFFSLFKCHAHDIFSIFLSFKEIQEIAVFFHYSIDI